MVVSCETEVDVASSLLVALILDPMLGLFLGPGSTRFSRHFAFGLLPGPGCTSGLEQHTERGGRIGEEGRESTMLMPS